MEVIIRFKDIILTSIKIDLCIRIIGVEKEIIEQDKAIIKEMERTNLILIIQILAGVGAMQMVMGEINQDMKEMIECINKDLDHLITNKRSVAKTLIRNFKLI